MLKRNNNKSNKRAKANRKRRYDGDYTVNRIVTEKLPSYVLSCPPLQREMDLSLKYVYRGTAGESSTPLNFRFPLTEFDAKTPAFLVRLYAIYKYCKILGMTITVEVTNQEQSAIYTAMGVLPLEEESLITDPAYLASLPRSVVREASSKGGMDRFRFTRTYNTAREVGQQIQSESGWQTQLQAINLATKLDKPAVFISTDSLNGDVWGANFVITVVYHLKLFELQRIADTVIEPQESGIEYMDEEPLPNKKSDRLDRSIRQIEGIAKRPNRK